jgi:hypothetical protein
MFLAQLIGKTTVANQTTNANSLRKKWFRTTIIDLCGVEQNTKSATATTNARKTSLICLQSESRLLDKKKRRNWSAKTCALLVVFVQPAPDEADCVY